MRRVRASSPRAARAVDRRVDVGVASTSRSADDSLCRPNGARAAADADAPASTPSSSRRVAVDARIVRVALTRARTRERARGRVGDARARRWPIGDADARERRFGDARAPSIDARARLEAQTDCLRSAVRS